MVTLRSFVSYIAVFIAGCLLTVLQMNMIPPPTVQENTGDSSQSCHGDYQHPSVHSHPANLTIPSTFKEFMDKAKDDLGKSLYRFDRPGLLLPLMRLQESELDPERRQRLARLWLRSRTLVVAATARNAMAGLPTTMRNLRRLRSLFNESWLLVVENDSKDSTRRYLQSLAKADAHIVLLGCPATVDDCKLDIRHSSGKQHEPGPYVQRNFDESVERGMIMSALRNLYLAYAYKNLPNADLLLIMDPDVTWADWNLDSILQGLYYFMAKPQLQQLCAHSILYNTIYDPCTLTFFINKNFGEDTKLPVVDYKTALSRAEKNRPPVKVSSCFQAFSFYRLNDLASRRLWYKIAKGEWMCEHNTLSRQLEEVYIDPQMKMQLRAMNIG